MISHRELLMPNGLIALIDDIDYEGVTQYNWRAYKGPRDSTFYVCRNTLVDGKKTTQKLHKFLTGYKQTDHINGNGLDNRRVNLRESTSLQNGANKRKSKSGTSKYKGVCWYKPSAKWTAQIMVNGKKRRLGYYSDEEAAAIAYDMAAIEGFGEFAVLNFPESRL